MIKRTAALCFAFLMVACQQTPIPTLAPETLTPAPVTPTLAAVTLTPTPATPTVEAVTPTLTPFTPTLAPETLTPPPVTPTASSLACAIGDQLPYIYHPARLKVIQSCVRILGRIEAVRNEGDGDVHMFVRLNDADAQQYLNAGNAHEKRDLVVEPVCVHIPTQADAIQPCSQDPDPLRVDQLPGVGDCVWIEGQLVEDTQHFSWREIHPPGRFEPGQGCPEARILTADDFFDPGD